MDRHPKFQDWILMIVLSIIWGSSFILMKQGLKAFRPDQVACIRIGITGIVLLPFAFSRRKFVSTKQTGTILIQGMFGNFIPAFLFPIAQRFISSSAAGILNSLSPVWVFVLGILFFSAKYKWVRLLGIFFAFAGVILLLLLEPSHGATTNLSYGLVIVLATLMYGLSANVIKKNLHDVHPLTITSISFAMAFIPALLFLFTTDFFSVLQNNPRALTSLIYILILGICGSAIASIIFNRLVHNTSALFASSVTYLMPIVALMWGYIDGESIQLNDFAGMAMIFAGVYLVSR